MKSNIFGEIPHKRKIIQHNDKIFKNVRSAWNEISSERIVRSVKSIPELAGLSLHGFEATS
jgi:hypothetical protein